MLEFVTDSMSLILASASPRRAELLRAAGLVFQISPADVDEAIRPGETPDAYVRRVAEAKATSVVPRAEGAWVLAADTIVVLGDDILGKPRDVPDARRMLRALSGRAHRVMTGVTLATPVLDTRVATTVVRLASLTDDEIEWYLQTNEPFDKAGAYAIQGYASRFVRDITGSYSNVVGLPVALLYDMIKSARQRAAGVAGAVNAR